MLRSWAVVVLALAGCVGGGRSTPEGAGDGAMDGASDAAVIPDGGVGDVGVVGDAEPDAVVVDRGPMDDGPLDVAPSDGGSPGCPPVEAEAEWVHGEARAHVAVGGTACARTFTLSTTAALRDGLPRSPRVVADAVDGPVVHTGDPWFDALYALAVEEAGQNAVDAIRDGAFREGQPVPCPPGGCFETGRLWNYVWTRDTAYAVDLGLGLLDPIRARNSLVLKVSIPREGGAPRIVQDTGTGGSWPVSTDRVAWALGARALRPWLDQREGYALAFLALDVLEATADDDDRAAFDPAIGLYRGEQSFLDWREQSYPDWVAGQPAHVAMSMALGTNVAHYAARRWLAELKSETGLPAEAARWDAAADALRDAIRSRLYAGPEALPSAFLTTALDRAPTRQHDLLGLALAIEEGVLDPDEGRAALSRWPWLPGGPPVIWPQQQFTPIYHNRGQWPFVTAYMVRATVRAQHAAALEAGVETLMRGAALNLSNMENFEAVSGRAWVEDGPYSGPVVNSQRQLWSVAGYVGMVHRVVFGVRAHRDRVYVNPRLTRRLRAARFGATERLVLSGLAWRGQRTVDVVLRLPPLAEDGPPDAAQGYRVAGMWLDGAAVEAPERGVALAGRPPGRRVIEVELAPHPWPEADVNRVADPEDWRTVFAPRSPVVEGLEWAGDGVSVTVAPRDDAVRVDVLRDGRVVAEDVRGPWVDRAVGADGQACYSARATFLESGLTSQHAEPRCWWGRDGQRVRVFEAEALDVLEGERADDHGRPHVRDPGGAGVAVPRFEAQHDGPHAFQVVYGNGAGPVESGITCAVRAVDVVSLSDGSVIDAGVIALPHLGRWDRWADSTLAVATLHAGQVYRVVVRGSAVGNMSRLAHFADYTAGPGGVEGPFEAANIAAVKVLALEPARGGPR